jgi:two-component system sensor kinase
MAHAHQGLTLLDGSKQERESSGAPAFGDNDETFRLLVEGIQDYAIFLLDKEGKVRTWNLGAERIKGYKSHEIIGQHLSSFYPQEARDSGWPSRELELAASQGRFSDEGWRVRKDGSLFWANIVITAIKSPSGELLGFSKITRDLTERRQLEERSQELNRQLNDKIADLTESRRQVELRTLELQRLSGMMSRVQDEERKRIARELHDDLGQHLAVLKLSLDTPQRRQNDSKLNEILELVDQCIAKVRNLSYLLHPPLLDESGLVPALHWYIDGFRKRSKLRITLEVMPSSFARLSSEMETAIFRIIQEGLTNVYRHSDSDDARIELRQGDSRIVIRVRDFGKGIPEEIALRPLSAGVGLGGIRERVKHFGGNMTISRAEPGTLLETSIPLLPSLQD